MSGVRRCRTCIEAPARAAEAEREAHLERALSASEPAARLFGGLLAVLKPWRQGHYPDSSTELFRRAPQLLEVVRDVSPLGRFFATHAKRESNTDLRIRYSERLPYTMRSKGPTLFHNATTYRDESTPTPAYWEFGSVEEILLEDAGCIYNPSWFTSSEDARWSATIQEDGRFSELGSHFTIPDYRKSQPITGCLLTRMALHLDLADGAASDAVR